MVAQHGVVDAVLDPLLHAVRNIEGMHVHIVRQRLRPEVGSRVKSRVQSAVRSGLQSADTSAE